jgi:hypothetical protein
MLYKIIFLVICLIIIGISVNVNAQDFSVKGGVGFYSFYKSNILTGREREITIDPTLITSVGLSWQLSDLFYLGWENSFRLKSPHVDFIGLDTTNNKIDTKYYVDFRFFNIDSKVIGKLEIAEFKDGKILIVAGTGLSLKLSYNSNYTTINKNVVVNLSDLMPPDVLDGNFFNNSGFITELGIEVKYLSLSCGMALLMELFKTDLYDVGDNKSILTQIIIGYNF